MYSCCCCCCFCCCSSSSYVFVVVFFVCLLSGPPVVTVFEPNPTNATENQATQFECYGTGLPLPTFSIKKLVPPPGIKRYATLWGNILVCTQPLNVMLLWGCVRATRSLHDEVPGIWFTSWPLFFLIFLQLLLTLLLLYFSYIYYPSSSIVAVFNSQSWTCLG